MQIIYHIYISFHTLNLKTRGRFPSLLSLSPARLPDSGRKHPDKHRRVRKQNNYDIFYCSKNEKYCKRLHRKYDKAQKIGQVFGD